MIVIVAKIFELNHIGLAVPFVAQSVAKELSQFGCDGSFVLRSRFFTIGPP